jgi:hypothetical protein
MIIAPSWLMAFMAFLIFFMGSFSRAASSSVAGGISSYKLD